MTCDICAIADGAGVKVLAFGLAHTSCIGERHTTRGMGSIRLCSRCWSETAAPRRRPQRRSRPLVAA